MSQDPACSDIENEIAELADILANAGTFFDVWSGMQDGSMRHDYEPVINAYPVFFETVVIAHIFAMSASIYSALETRTDTHNIPALIKMARKAKFDGHELTNIEQQIESCRPAWIKIARIRNEVFDHRARRMSSSQVCSDVQLLPEEIGSLIQELKKVLVRIAFVCRVEVPNVLSLSAKSDTTNLMALLSRACAP